MATKNYIEQQETSTGASASGSTGTANRVFTLSNTGLTKQGGFLVYVSGLALALDQEYTVSHLSASTTITFLNKLWDDQTIIIAYFEESVTVNLFETLRTDFQSIIVDNGQTGTLIRQAETTDSVGGVVGIIETEYTIITILEDITKKDRQIHEMGLAVTGNIKAYFYHEYPNSITGNGIVSVQVGDIYKESSGKVWRVEAILGEKYMDEKEIFRTAILKNIGLDE